MQGSPFLRPAQRLRHGERIMARRSSSVARSVAGHPDAIQEEPAPLQYLAIQPHRGCRGKGTSVPAAPRFLSRMIEREQQLAGSDRGQTPRRNPALPAAVTWRLDRAPQ
jgi:hypothetical protein